jgi:dipeptidyl aminopeptidase/acylaminoacyl peptidase
MSRLALAAFLVPLLTAAALAEGPARNHDVTLDDYFTLAGVTEAVPSPDGTLVAYAEARWQASTDDRKSDLWLADAATGRARRLTFDRADDRSLAWAPDGRSLYFLGGRKREGERRPPYDGTTQVWQVAAEGGEPRAVTHVEGGVRAWELARDGRSLYYLLDRDDEQGEWKDLRGQFKEVVPADAVRKVSVVWKLDLQTWRATKLIDEVRYVHEMSVAPGGRRVALITAPDERVVSFEGRSRVDVFDVAAGKCTPLPDKLWRQEAPSPYAWLEGLAWSPDGRHLAFNTIFDGYPAEAIVAEWPGGRPNTFRLRRPDGASVRGYGSPLQWRAPGCLCVILEEKARARLCEVTDVGGGKQGSVRVLTPGDVAVSAFRWNAAGERGAVVLADPGHFPDVHLMTPGGEPRRLTDVNPQAASWKMPRTSVVSWKGARGDTVEGVLELPPDSAEGKPVPLVVDLHGGPTAANTFAAEYRIYTGRTLLPARGYAVLSPNYRGSTGYGDKFLTDLVGQENGVEVEDILAGVDALVERGVADRDRLAVMGWSNGGYLTNCVIAKTTRFKAASSGAGIVDTVMEWGTNDEPAYMVALKGGLPWSRPDVFRRTSPTYALDKVRTPTIIHVGGSDERCPPPHSRMLYRALSEYNHVPTQLLVYPGEPHGLRKYRHHKAKLSWDLAWFDRHVLGKGGR